MFFSKMKIVSFTKRKIVQLVILITFFFISINIYQLSKHFGDGNGAGVDGEEYRGGTIVAKLLKVKEKKQLENNFAIAISKERINTLFDIMTSNEEKFKSVFEKLDLMMFSDMINNTKQSYSKFGVEIGEYLHVDDHKRLVATDLFVSDLKYLSNYYSFLKPRDAVEPKAISSDKRPAIVTAANSEYYYPLEATVYFLHQHLPAYDLIIYDLGLTADQLEKTKAKCKCIIKKFDESGEYTKIAPHVKDLKTYAWKPIIIQETLKTYDTVLYMDSSIRITTGKLEPILDAVSVTGLLSQFIGLKLTCYTNPKMFEWFHETDKIYTNLDTIEANFLIMKRNFVNALIMKAWITCALDPKCIAPEGSRITGCCGCHRFDQDALTIVTTFFYGHPVSNNDGLPLYAFTKNESYFFNVRRHEGMPYFDGGN